MEDPLDVRDQPRAERRDSVFDRLDRAEAGETVAITAETDVRPSVAQYRIERETALEWTLETDGPDAWEVHVTKRAESAAEAPEFDVREIPPKRRHEVLTDTFDRLEPGQGFVLVNDHDPEPLYHELRSTHGDVVGWEYASRDAGEWRVEIAKTDESDAATDDDVAATFDVREIPKPERHPTIHHRYGNLEAGDAMEIVAPHEPKPLHQEFQQQYGDAFEWAVMDRSPGEVRVRITKGSGGADGADEAGGDLAVTTELDVRDRPPAERHELIFESYADLEAGEGFVLVNDHDPKPLYHQFEAEAGPEFHWEYRLKDPGEFRVLIGKTDAGSGSVSTAANSDAATADDGPQAPF
ncbi:hypothetical protein C488_08602 [Natrinema pellirubrum DSM 15624]|uniref:DUF2249 domain-containing protein n=1 Tax=Natrinema pellirubrum (strain DSM 15624 / CIP 106293 / JCM 10476 / NCIMB 786 / 157) TaxID=797303 RepID=L0JMD4_NATP1|nr:DUF2249 domain-containing protein [Natrinema pellirubrum]AGB32695.1 hypothetical protein Natpe_2898 [Natrinema pellirubrum DSM 15624]ELY75906.1 hypothetical protein C488_08602 [Natrinema pellirubrum DSM 15624]